MNKLYNSHAYLKKIRVLTGLVKTLRNLDRVPNALSRPAKNVKKQEAYDKAQATTVTKATLRYWLTAPEYDDTRRSVRPADRIDAVLKDSKPTDSVKY